jgi:hypothetical protein
MKKQIITFRINVKPKMLLVGSTFYLFVRSGENVLCKFIYIMFSHLQITCNTPYNQIFIYVSYSGAAEDSKNVFMVSKFTVFIFRVR